MKKLLTLFVVAIVFGFSSAYSEEFMEDGINYRINSLNSSLVSVCRLPNSTHYFGDIDIPSSVEHEGIKYTVSGISNWAFENCSEITSITMPQSIMEIGESAFAGCSQLTNLSFPDSIKYLEICVCYGCDKLSNLYLPSGIQGIGRSAFNGCSSLEEFVIPDSVKEIDRMAFKNCSGLKKIYWGKSVEKVGGDLFTECRILSEVHISDISKWCKTNFASGLANPLYQQGIVGGGTKLFLNGELVETLFVPNDIDIVRKYTFYGYTWLKSIRFPETNMKVEDNAFSECRQLNSVYFGESTIQLGNSAFNHCEDIQYVVSKCREPYMFWDWTFYKPIYDKCTLFIPTGTKEIYASTSGWKNFTKVKETDVDDPGLKVSLKVSGEGKVSVNDTNVDDNNTIIVLYDTDIIFSFKPQLGYQLKSFLINGEELVQDVVNDIYVINQIHDNINVEIIFEEIPLAEGVLFSDNRIFYRIIENVNGFCLEVTREMKSGNTWSYIGDVVIPEYVVFHGDTLFVERIGENAFKGSNSLYSVSMPNTIKAIGKSAFESCTVIKSITIPSSVEIIENGAFNGCKAISSFVIPNSVKRIEARAFYACTKLSSITFSNSLCDVGYDAFGDTKWYNSKSGGLVYAGPVAYKYKGTIPQGTSVNINIMNGTLGIAEQCFLNCAGLSSITISGTVTIIGESAFGGCAELTSITIPYSVKSIGERAFENCTSLKKIEVLPTVPPSIYDNSFSNFSVPVKVPKGCQEVYRSADGWKNFINIYDKEKFKLTYIVDGAEYKSYDIAEDDVITPEPDPIKEGYTFSGWSEIPEKMPAHDVTVTGSFSINKYKLTYMVDGVEYKSYDIEYGATINPEAEPVKEGYIFSGWSTIPTTMPAYDVTITGSFTKGAFKLTYMLDGVVYKTISYDYGDAITPEPAPVKEEYTFSGWSEIPETMPAHDVTVTGTFTINKYKLTYTVDSKVYKTYDIEYGATITPIAEPIKEGYSFSGWSEIPASMPAHDVTISGTFSINKYKLTYIVDGIEYKSYDIEYGATITPEAEPTKEGYIFSGWSEIPEIMPAHDVTVIGTFTLDTGIEEIMSNANGDVMIFTIDGKRVDNLKKGMNIIRMKDGTTRKVVVK